MALSVLNNPNMVIGKQYTVNGVAFVFRKTGRIVSVIGSGQPTNAITSGGYAGTVQLDSEYYPFGNMPFYILARPGIGMQINLSSTGEFKYGYSSETISTTSTVYCTFTYVSAT